MKIASAFALALLLGIVPLSAQTSWNGDEPSAASLDDLYRAIDKSPAGLDAYKSLVVEHQGLVAGLAIESVLSTITFNEPVAWEDAFDALSESGLDASLVYAFFREPDGLIGTGAGRLGGASHDDVRQAFEEMAEDKELLGIVSVIGMLPVESLDAVQADARVFLVDATGDGRFSVNPGNQEHMHHLGWDLFQNREAALK